MEYRRRRRAAREPSQVGSVAGWGGFAVVIGALSLLVADPSEWQRLLWLVPVGMALVGVAAAAVWALPQRPLPPEDTDPGADDLR